MFFVMFNNFSVGDRTAKNIQSRSDSVADTSFPGIFNSGNIGKTGYPAGINCRNWRIVAQQIEQLVVDPGTFALDIHGVNEKFCTASGKFFQSFRIDCQRGEIFPAVTHYHIFAIGKFAAGEIQNQMFFADSFEQFLQIILLKFAIGKNKTGDDHLCRTVIEEKSGIFRGYPAADLQMSLPGVQSFQSRLIVIGSQFDDMPPMQIILMRPLPAGARSRPFSCS